MKLKVKKKLSLKVPEKKKDTTKKSGSSTKKNTLPPDQYQPMFEPMRVLVRETPSTKGDGMVRQYIEVSVKRFGDDEVNKPNVYIQMYQESDFYTGYMKGKCVYLPLESLEEVISLMTSLSEECDKRQITY